MKKFSMFLLTGFILVLKIFPANGGVAEALGSNPIQIPASYKPSQTQTYKVKLNEPLVPVTNNTGNSILAQIVMQEASKMNGTDGINPILAFSGIGPDGTEIEATSNSGE